MVFTLAGNSFQHVLEIKKKQNKTKQLELFSCNYMIDYKFWKTANVLAYVTQIYN